MKTRLTCLLLVLCLLSGCQNVTTPAVVETDPLWQPAVEILSRIKAPKFPDREFAITDYGARIDGDASDAIRQAIDLAHNSGGGRVVVPPGTFFTGPVHLKSNVNLHLSEGSTLKFVTDPQRYLPAVFTRWEGVECMNYSPFVYAFEQENIAITGTGTLDGQASNEHWWPMTGVPRFGGTVGRGAQRTRLFTLVTNNVAPEQRDIIGFNLRPQFIQPYRCKNVLIEGVKIRNSPMWEVHPVLCTNVIIRGLDIVSHGPNNDGCNPESCKDVLIENCLFDTGDDCIAIKSGRNDDGRRVNVPTENVVIRNCVMKDGHGGVVIGSEMSGSVRNVYIENCTMDSPELDRALRFKSNAVRGGVIENVYMRNVKVGKVAREVLQIDFVYEEGARGPHKPVAQNIVMRNITVAQTPRIVSAVGFPGSVIKDVRIYNSTFKQVAGESVIREADVQLIDCVEEPIAPTTNPAR